MSFSTLALAAIGWWLVWVLRPVLVPALDRFWAWALKNVEL